MRIPKGTVLAVGQTVEQDFQYELYGAVPVSVGTSFEINAVGPLGNLTYVSDKEAEVPV